MKLGVAYEVEQLQAIEAIKRGKARYFRGVDTGDTELVRGVLAENCELDYQGCCTDPQSGRDYMPAMNLVLRGRDNWTSKGFAKAGIVSVHQGSDFDIDFTSPTSARVICAMTDRMFMPAGAPFRRLVGYGHYHETWENLGDGWKIKTLRLLRLRVQVD
jgi:hypothetical protein